MIIDSGKNQNLEEETILDYLPREMTMMGSGNPIIDEGALWGQFYQEKLIEKSDRKKFESVCKKGTQLFIYSLFLSGITNRVLTNVRLGSLYFMNLRSIFRLPIRLLITYKIFHYFFYQNTYNNLMEFKKHLNSKYIPRFINYVNSQGDPLAMNPTLLNDPTMTEEEREQAEIYYKQMKNRNLSQLMGPKP